MGKRHTPEQIILQLRLADEKLAAGAPLSEVAGQLEISEATFHRWRNQATVGRSLMRSSA